MKVINLLLILLLSCASANAQENLTENKDNQQKFESIDSKDGLIHNTIHAIFQDSKGHMWFGAFNGIYKFDGYNLKLYKKNSPLFIENHITAIYEDGFGVVWIGTRKGLYYYDRDSDNFYNKINLEEGKNRNLVITNYVNQIYQDSNNTLWVSTSAGLYILNRSDKQPHIFSFKAFNNSTMGVVKAIIEDQKGNLWLGTNQGLKAVSYNNFDNELIDYTHFLAGRTKLTNQNITALSNDKYGNIWVGTTNGLNKINWDKIGKHIYIENFYKNNIEGLSGNNITTICPDVNGTVWVGTRDNGISRYLPEKNIFINYKNNPYDDNSINSNHINTIYQGENNIIWIGCEGGAINKLDPYKKQFLHYNHSQNSHVSLSDNMINYLYEDLSKNIWICTDNGGINKFESHKNSPPTNTYIKPFNAEDRYLSICQDNLGNFWIGTYDNGLYHVRFKETGNVTVPIVIKHYTKESGDLPIDRIETIYKDHNGDLWMGSLNSNIGLMKITPNKFGENPPKVISYKLDAKVENSGVATIFEDRNHILWVGTYGGGVKRIIRNKKNVPISFTTIKHNSKDPKSLSSDNAFSFYEDFDHNLWIATFGGGLNKIVKDEKYKAKPNVVSYREKDGLSNEELYGILEDDKKNLWISSNNGIYKFNINKEVFTNYRISDGLQGLNFRRQSSLKSNNGLFYFGGINGINVFNPDLFVDNPFAPRTEIVGLRIFGENVEIGEEILGKVILTKSISETQEIVLNHNHKSFSLEFSALHYSSPNQNKFTYKLEGWDKNWIYTNAKNRNAYYANLQAGTYIFKVKTANNDNLWNDKYKQIKITILPAPWETWWAYSSYALIFIGLLWWFRRTIIINEKYKNELKIERVNQEKIKEINNLKLEFFTNVSHEFKTPLTLILGPLQSMIDLVSKGKKIKKESLILMDRNAKHLYRLINQIIEFRQIESDKLQLNLSKGDIVGFCRDILTSFSVLAKSKKINLYFNTNEENFNCLYDWDKLEKIATNLIANAVKFTKSGGEVIVTLSILNNDTVNSFNKKLVLEVSDTGQGIAKDQLQLIFNRFYRTDNEKLTSPNSGIGLALTKSLVEFMKGTIEAESVVNHGSTFKVELPININTEDNLTPSTKNNDAPTPEFQDVTLRNEDVVYENADHLNEKINGTINKDGKLKTLLIVEDNIDMQVFLKETLGLKYHVIQAYDGEAGFDQACESIPDIIISDIMMPKKDGVELCAALKNSHITNHIPIILLTAKSAVEHQIKGLEVGADAYLSKPFNLNHLEVQLENLLKQRELLRELFSSSQEPSFYSETPKIKVIDKEFLGNAEKIIDINLINPQFGVEEFSDKLNLSQMQLYRKLKSITDYSTNDFIKNYRLKKAAQLLRETNLNITQVLYEVGYSSRSYFTKCFKENFGLTPKEYINKQKNSS